MRVSDLISLASTPGPMQGMAQAALAEIARQDRHVELVGRSPSSGPGGLNYGDPAPGHASYPAALLDALTARYGEQAVPPSGDEASGHMEPAPEAQRRWREEFEPSLWEKIKAIGSGIMDDPTALIAPAADIASYSTPVAGNMRGSQDFYNDYNEAYNAWPTSPDHGDPLGVLLKYLPGLALDAGQMLSPMGFKR